VDTTVFVPAGATATMSDRRSLRLDVISS
jgi:hypothetical protein